MTDQEWQEGIERALNHAWTGCVSEAAEAPGPREQEIAATLTAAAIKGVAAALSQALPLRITLCHTGKDKLGHFRVGPARYEEA